ncbi:NADH-quinone oxidoreductase subunit H [Actinomycetospora termitidis]|uniref:NADH-quinone oxidoreductase subunit H n=1 Tax=Actinomycetospora termitidis TaxID=3053470 RepID=A0ABT7MD37_9PSEU|nr:NADH-quinone oxidoreductase subunit H [Actinomycetospora sp. Odt1-22]MDL5158575.1 NADH-quinone oxidoreductase subunit H [Actinomycetospora sp. Odt1-22]
MAAGAGAVTAGDHPATPVVETLRLLAKQRRRTPADDPALARIGLTVLPVAAVLALAVVPLGDTAPVDLDVGVVWFNAMEVLAWFAVWVAGWGPNAVTSLAGGYRMLPLGLAYELPHMLAIITPAIAAGSLAPATIAAAQHDLWYAVWMPAAFVLYLVSVAAMAFWGPFAAPLGRDLAGGAVAEHAGLGRLLLHAGRWMLLTAGAAMAVPLFLGGGAPPPITGPDPFPGLPALWFAVKLVVVIGLLLAARRVVPMLRTARFVTLAWTVLIPLAVAQALVVTVVVLT